MDTPRSLYRFLEAASDCAKGAFQSNASAVRRCAELDAFIEKSAAARLQVPTATLLRLSARGMFCASINTALIGYRAAIFPTLRACLEAACYAQVIEQKPELGDVWAKRHRDQDARKRCRAEFSDAVKKTCKRFGKLMPENAGLITDMYDSMIDDGAHPNVRSIIPSIKMEETNTHFEVGLGLVLPSRVETSLFCCFEIGLFTSWLMTDLDEIDENFWIEAANLNEMKNEWEKEILGGRAG
ncbi:hypothetical protein XcmpCFBP7700_11455 [Xanthomonas campestris]|uniref:hypothetical protein n=1 Tax=Xanthomonas campestris TaxID=339 RepID=UPI000E7141E7|nr:hypothetical protein [Xanthomonas campestris]RJU11738.1 hypothetical protein XcmpCFBP7700_11455 [Xanthomonas campestris]